MNQQPIQNARAVLDEQIDSLMVQIVALCKEHHIRLHARFELASGSTKEYQVAETWRILERIEQEESEG